MFSKVPSIFRAHFIFFAENLNDLLAGVSLYDSDCSRFARVDTRTPALHSEAVFGADTDTCIPVPQGAWRISRSTKTLGTKPSLRTTSKRQVIGGRVGGLPLYGSQCRDGQNYALPLTGSRCRGQIALYDCNNNRRWALVLLHPHLNWATP